MTSELTGLSKNYWLSGPVLDSIKDVCIDIYENKPTCDYYADKNIHDWLFHKNKNYKDIIIKYCNASDEIDIFDKCGTHMKFSTEERLQLVEEAKNKANTIIVLWKPIIAKN
jgi:hypothetical protein